MLINNFEIVLFGLVCFGLGWGFTKGWYKKKYSVKSIKTIKLTGKEKMIISLPGVTSDELKNFQYHLMEVIKKNSKKRFVITSKPIEVHNLGGK